MTQLTPVPETASDRSFARSMLGWTVFCGVLSLALYLAMPGFFARLTSSEPSFAFEVFPWLKTFTRETLGPIRGRPDNFHGSAPFLFGCAGLFTLYAILLQRARGCRSLRVQAVVFGFGALFLGSFLFSPTMLSTDVFAYAFYGRLVSVYGADAYSTSASFNPSDPYLLLYGHKFFGSVYGPVWTLISAGITKLTGERVGLTVFLFRLLAAGSILAGAGLAWNVLRRRAPDCAARGLVLFLWNPLVIMETAGGCHNDATLAALLLLGIWLHVRGWRAGAVVAMTLGALVKVIAAPLVLLYAWAVLRESRLWRERIRFLAGAGAGVVLSVALAFHMAHARAASPVSKFSSAPDFYLNNYHELLFNGLRRALGEDTESVATPMNFGSWWVEAQADAVLRTEPSENAAPVRTIKTGERVLVIAPQYTEWLRVYDPASGRRGYVPDDSLEQIPNPPGPAPDAESERLQVSPMRWPTVVLANRCVRAAMTALFAVFGLLAALKTTNFDRFLIWSCAVLAMIYVTVATQIWPWYAIWALALGALKPANAPARLAVLVSAGMLTLYALLGFGMSRFECIYAWRSIPAIVAPVVVWAVWEGFRRRGGFGEGGAKGT